MMFWLVQIPAYYWNIEQWPMFSWFFVAFSGFRSSLTLAYPSLLQSFHNHEAFNLNVKAYISCRRTFRLSGGSSLSLSLSLSLTLPLSLSPATKRSVALFRRALFLPFVRFLSFQICASFLHRLSIFTPPYTDAFSMLPSQIFRSPCTSPQVSHSKWEIDGFLTLWLTRAERASRHVCQM